MEEKEYKHILVDQPDKNINRITLNRPKKRNALNNVMRGEIFDALKTAETEKSIRVTIIKGAGTCFSSGYDLSQNEFENRPWFTPPYTGVRFLSWAHHVTEGWFRMWDMAKPIIAQVHGYCLAGASELATACDLVYVAEDAQIGYPVVRSMSVPDLQYPVWVMGMRAAMEFMLTGSPINGKEAVRVGFANRAFPRGTLENQVLEMARKVALIPSDLQVINKRSVHQAMEIMGIRTAIKAGHTLHSLGWHSKTSEETIKKLFRGELNKVLTERDEKFGDYSAKKEN